MGPVYHGRKHGAVHFLDKTVIRCRDTPLAGAR